MVSLFVSNCQQYYYRLREDGGCTVCEELCGVFWTAVGAYSNPEQVARNTVPF